MITIDWSRALKAIADMPEVKRAVAGMRDKGIAEHLITLGLANRPGSLLVPAIGFFAAGAVCGAAAAMLLTPRTGEAFREDIASLFKNAGSRMSERARDRREARGDGEERRNGATA